MSSTAIMNTRKTMTLLVISLVVDMLAFTCILPLFPTVLTFYSKEGHRDSLYDWFVSLLHSFQSLIGVPINDRYHNVFFGGLLGSLFSALQFIASPTVGALSDVYGRRNMLLFSCFGTMLSYVIWLRADTFSLFVLSRIVGGLSKANINVATAMVSDIYSPQDHPKGMAMIGISYSLGFLIGPMIGAYFSTIVSQTAPHITPALFAITMTIVEFFLVAFCLPETLNSNERSKSDVRGNAKKLVNPAELFKFSAVSAPIGKKEEMQQFGLTYFIYLFLYAGLEFTLPFLTHLRFNFGSMDQGKIYLFTGLIMIPIQGHVVRKTPMHNQKRLAEIGIICAIPAFMIIANAYSKTMLYVGLFLYAIASATVVSCLTSCVSAVYPQSDKGALSGVFRSLGSLARALGPIFAATLFWLTGPTSCYFIGGILLLLPLKMIRKIRNPVEENLRKE